MDNIVGGALSLSLCLSRVNTIDLPSPGKWNIHYSTILVLVYSTVSTLCSICHSLRHGMTIVRMTIGCMDHGLIWMHFSL
jgi:hypothetical protein